MGLGLCYARGRMSIALTARVVDNQTNETFEASFERFPVRLGRNQLNDLHIDRPYISQFHAAIEVHDQQIVIKDLGSTNGTVYQGQKIARDQLVDITGLPEIQVGPIVIHFSLKEVKPRETELPRELSILDVGTAAGAGLLEQRQKCPSPGQEDPFIRQLVPYVDAYRQAWANVYRLVYEHLTRLMPEVRTNYLQRLLIEHPSLAQEGDFQKVSQYYGVPAYSFGELTMPQASFAAFHELWRTLAPDQPTLDDPPKLLGFARRLRDSMEVFLKCFISLRDGHQEFETEVLRRERYDEQGNRVGAAKDDGELGFVLFGPEATEETSRHLHEVFVEVMTHQVALMNGVMEGVKQLLDKLSPNNIEMEFDRRGKKGGVFSNKYESLWKFYETCHGDYSGEDKETFLIIFGPQFARAYSKTTGEAFQTSADASSGSIGRFTVAANQTRR